MKLTIPTKALVAALETLRPVFSGRTTLPAISMIRLETTDKLTISANNLDLYCAAKAPCEVSSPGEFAVAGLRLLNAAKSCLGEEITLEVKDKSLHFKSGKSVMRMSGLDCAELPAAFTCEAIASCSVSGSDFFQALSEVSGFASVDAKRYNLLGVYFEGGETLNLVATEGHILAARQLSVPCKGASAIVPNGAVALMKTIRGEVRLTFDEKNFLAETDEIKIVGRQIEGKFPQWRNVIPARKEQEISATVNRDEMLAALPFVSFVEGGLKGPRVNMLIGRSEITFSAKRDEQDGSVSIPATVKGRGFEICFDVAYLRIALMANNQPEITFLFRDNMSPLLIEQGENKTVVQAMRVQ